MITFTNYGEVPPYRQAEIMNASSANAATPDQPAQNVRLEDGQVRMILDRLTRVSTEPGICELKN
jgi:hypothetical protein